VTSLREAVGIDRPQSLRRHSEPPELARFMGAWLGVILRTCDLEVPGHVGGASGGRKPARRAPGVTTRVSSSWAGPWHRASDRHGRDRDSGLTD
jgi:hypothetical protein